eukprot:TRINITY_DN5136_c0_g1_i2.p1 TRINITY_DN5136_c0_g1~~TRINITY_DN5136_c0_g1_i2.p1  ORF type:complete len:474 (-),score=109.86 TRINITY_DN5136_c0_g1_i2:61-1482(-)
MAFFFFFKQKTAYEMLRSLVGSEMCIRDRVSTQSTGGPVSTAMFTTVPPVVTALIVEEAVSGHAGQWVHPVMESCVLLNHAYATLCKRCSVQDRRSAANQRHLDACVPTADEQAAMERLNSVISAMVSSALPGFELVEFGSTAVGIHLPGADLDLALIGRSELPPQELLAPLQQQLSESWLERVELIVSQKKQVAVISCLDPRSGISADIALRFGNPQDTAAGPQKAALLHGLCSLSPAAAPLCRLVKRWAQDRRLEMNSFCWTLLVMSFLQQCSELAPGDSLAERTETCRDNLESPLLMGGDNQNPLAKLLAGFMRFWAGFGFESSVVCVSSGVVGRRWEFPKIARRHGGRAVVIIDPVEHWDNPAANVTRHGLDKIVAELAATAVLLESGYSWDHLGRQHAGRPCLSEGAVKLFVDLDGTLADFESGVCLLYTSDAADEEDSVDLGGRRIIKKKKKEGSIRQGVMDKIQRA